MKKLKKFFNSFRYVKWYKWLILGLFTTGLIIWCVWINSDIAMNALKDLKHELGGVEYSVHMLYAVSTFTILRWCIYATLSSLVYSMFTSIIKDIKGAKKDE